jgi:hypothetical protein
MKIPKGSMVYGTRVNARLDFPYLMVFYRTQRLGKRICFRSQMVGKLVNFGV